MDMIYRYVQIIPTLNHFTGLLKKMKNEIKPKIKKVADTSQFIFICF